jgi:hypothetical protein
MKRMKLAIKPFLLIVWISSIIVSLYLSQYMLEDMSTHRLFMPKAGYIDVVSNPQLRSQFLALYAVASSFVGLLKVFAWLFKTK